MDDSKNQQDAEMEGITNDPQQTTTTTNTTTSSGDDVPEHSGKKRKREEPSTVSVPSSGTREEDEGEGENSAERSDLSSSDSNKKHEGNGGQSSNGEQSSSGNASSSDNAAAAAKGGQRVKPSNNIEKVWLSLLKERPSKSDRDKMKLWIECVLLTSEYMAPSAPSDEQDSSNSKSSGSNSGSGSNSMSNSGGNISNDELSELLVADAMTSLESIHRVMLTGIHKRTSTDNGQISSENTNSSDEKNSSNSRSSNEEEGEMKDGSPTASGASLKVAAVASHEVTASSNAEDEEDALDDGRIFPRLKDPPQGS